MDNIEQLLRDADPRMHRDSGGPLPLDLDEPGPVFAQQPVHKSARQRRSWVPVALGAMVTAAAVAAVVVWSPWNAPLPDPLPAITPTPSPTAPAPSGTGTADPTSRPESLQLPNGLFPAYDGAHFADDAACRALSLPEMQFADVNGKLSNPGLEAEAFALIGCLDGFAAFTPSEQYRTELMVDDVAAGMLIAKWNPEAGHWASSPVKLAEDGVEVHQEYLSWPLLRGYTYEADETAEQRMNRAIKDKGIPAEVAETLFGPNEPSWMETETGAERITYDNTLLEVTHPSWDMYEIMRDQNGKVLESAVADPREASVYQLMFFDSHGKAVFNLGLFTDDRAGQDESETCDDPSGTYTLHGLSPTSVAVDEGKLALGLVTETDVFGIERSTVSLVPADSATEGRLCDLATSFHLDGKMLQSEAWTGYLGFKDATERTAYLQSSEYLRAREVAASLEIR
ncbi:hypothetical protein KRR55_15275 [Paeniglutamicibacter sp. ABSL32-1]|uniref:hypothetical protein n=1 Tax=Paeniglutamicibacter quisquiliarum TaxID=2849498 RepID=UPI001C2D07E2|nr:hypothetical protein [Paeniglutamicibacter quisquiliarum]MBV1780477.1 hypothetical protein [Paeniglutamicibacter quisquiliarum]